MKIARNILLALFISACLYLFFWPVPVNPEAWQVPEIPQLQGIYTPNTYLSAIEQLGKGEDIGAEDVDVDSLGWIYGSFVDGRILRFTPDGTHSEEFVNTGGRPLGMEFDSQENLIVADGEKGLLSVSPEGELTLLATEADGSPFRLTDDLDVGVDGKIYFSDASDKFPLKDYIFDLMEHRPNGRLLVYDPKTKETTLLLDDLYFANGVAVSPDLNFVLVVETSSYRVKKYWLKGDKQGTSEVIIDNLPGFPDGISSNGQGIFWMAIASPRNPLIDRFAPSPLIRKMLLRLPKFMLPAPERYGFVLGIDGNGNVLHNLQDPSPESYSPITSVEENEGILYLGSLTYDAIGRIKAPQS
ncbi:MAG: SMP-30/gluconolactonase/LRE family protein [Prochloraceae cyanobacterium]